MKIFIHIIFFFLAAAFINAQEGIDIWTTTSTTIGRVFGMVIDPSNQSTMYACGLDQGVNKTTNGGLSWTQMNNGILFIQVQAIAICKNNPQNLYVGTAPGTGAGVYKTTNGGTNWTQVNTGITETIGVQALLVHPDNPNIAWVTIFTGTADAVNGIYKTTDGGANWLPITNGIGTIKNFLALAMSPVDANTIYLGSSFLTPAQTGPSVIYKTTDGGTNWVLSSTGLPSDPTEINAVRVLQVDPGNPNVVAAGLFMNTVNGGFYLSTDAGASWVKKHTGLPTTTGTLIRSLAIRSVLPNQFFVGLDRSTFTDIGVFFTSDAGNNWTSFNGGTMLNTYGIRALLFNTTGNHTLFAGVSTATGQGVYDYTFSFIPVELVSFSAEVFAGNVSLSWITATELNNYGFQIERKNAESNEWINIGFVNGNGNSSEMKYYWFTDNSVPIGKYFYRLKQTDFSGSFDYSEEIEVTILEVLNDFELMQNYPNPFNPSTRINFSIPKNSFVTLKVFDILGNEIETLISRDLAAGNYEIEFSGNTLTSGVYFYNLTAGEFSKTMKMILSR